LPLIFRGALVGIIFVTVATATLTEVGVTSEAWLCNGNSFIGGNDSLGNEGENKKLTIRLQNMNDRTNTTS
jgi:hypothetical protein